MGGNDEAGAPAAMGDERGVGAAPALRLEGLRLTLPGGRPLFDDLSLSLAPGEIVVLLGGSGAGKSTLLRAIFEPRELRRAGFSVELGRFEVDGELGLVPQRGALFDHLDVAGNLALAHRQRLRDGKRRDQAGDAPLPHVDEAVGSWLREVDLPDELARRGSSVARLSGGQAQRLAVARTLAGGRKVLVLDEPSVGLDPLRVEGLARLLREQAQRGVALLVVTHDLDLAAAVADRVLLLDPGLGGLRPLLEVSSTETPDASTLREALTAALAAPKDANRGAPSSPLAALLRGLFGLAHKHLGALAVPGISLFALPTLLRHHLRDGARIFGRTLAAGMLRPAPFYAIVAAILGYTVLYVIARSLPEGLRVGRAIELVGGSYILALTPPVCAFLFSAVSGSALNAWLGTLDLTRQTTALEALGIRRDVYLVAPVWIGLSLAFAVVAALFAAGMAAGGAFQAFNAGVQNPWPLLLGDLLDPAPDRWMLRCRAAWLLGLYAVGISADVVHRGLQRKEHSEQVTRAMTASVISTTLWVVGLELCTALWLWRR